jgi:hypothetical protein
MALVELRRCYSSIEADVMRSVLAAEGIDSYVFDTQMNFGGLDGAIPVRLMVDEDELEEARLILAEDQR